MKKWLREEDLLAEDFRTEKEPVQTRPEKVFFSWIFSSFVKLVAQDYRHIFFFVPLEPFPSVHRGTFYREGPSQRAAHATTFFCSSTPNWNQGFVFTSSGIMSALLETSDGNAMGMQPRTLSGTSSMESSGKAGNFGKFRFV